MTGVAQLCQENLPTATHASPSDAVQIHLDARSRNTVGAHPLFPRVSHRPLTGSRTRALADARAHTGIHFGTFQGSHLEALEALHALQTACDDAGVRDLGDTKEGKRGRMGKLDIGETLVVEGPSFIVSLAGSGRELTGRTQCSRRRGRCRVSRTERPALQVSHKLPSLEY